MVTDPKDMEMLADQEHESWSGWTKWMLSQIGEELDQIPGLDSGTLLAALDCIKRWRRQMVTPYAELSEREKESDRKVVREKLALYRPESGDSKILADLKTCLAVCVGAGGTVSAVELRELVKACGLDLG